MSAPTQEQIAALAYYLWEERGRPEGSASLDWEEAERKLQDPERDLSTLIAQAAQREASATRAVDPAAPPKTDPPAPRTADSPASPAVDLKGKAPPARTR